VLLKWGILTGGVIAVKCMSLAGVIANATRWCYCKCQTLSLVLLQMLTFLASVLANAKPNATRVCARILVVLKKWHLSLVLLQFPQIKIVSG
jgi:hypothetical protein